MMHIIVPGTKGETSGVPSGVVTYLSTNATPLNMGVLWLIGIELLVTVSIWKLKLAIGKCEFNSHYSQTKNKE